MDLELTGRVAIVTGASRGVGKAIAQELALEGVADADEKALLEDIDTKVVGYI